MSRSRLYIIVLLALVALVLIGVNLTETEQSDPLLVVNEQPPTYQSRDVVTLIYDPTGKLSYQLVAEQAKHYTEEELNWFVKPVVTLFDERAVATWSARANSAKLTKERMLYLYGDVEVKSLTPMSQLERIKTDNAQINLVTQDVSSDDRVTLFGTNFTTTGMRLRGNLRDRTAELLDKVESSYEIRK
ncbi:LPS export ABC transporter periplasmic protein LptC [Serratia microhaemolytica]|uniref:LPS export ABC transporter periplasmic protein LptC n=1 Tax=Serratia microhaemolytica TaxID=2675110 RepID=UPI000FDEDC03|nr:LPS export ABC transporter periplasmic protein LptC [Serratia microhaemolytica]